MVKSCLKPRGRNTGVGKSHSPLAVEAAVHVTRTLAVDTVDVTEDLGRVRRGRGVEKGPTAADVHPEPAPGQPFASWHASVATCFQD